MKIVFIISIITLNSFAFNSKITNSITTIDDILSYFGCNVKSKEIECNMIKRHLKRDTKKCWISPTKINDLLPILSEHQISKENPLHIKGANKYLGFVPGRYSYFVYPDERGVKIETSINFFNKKKFDQTELQQLQNKMNQASFKWSNFSPYATPINFGLKLAKNKREAHIKLVHLTRKDTRGPYFINWSSNWRYNTIAHEMGHMLGLDDEYRNDPFGGSAANCNSDSIMCSSYRGNPHEYQYYMILRRALCQI